MYFQLQQLMSVSIFLLSQGLKYMHDNEEAEIHDFFRQYTMKDAVDNIDNAWKKVKQSCLNGVWRKIYPDAIRAHAADATDDTVILNLASQIAAEEITAEDIEEIVNEDVDFTNEEILQMGEGEESSDEDETEPRMKTLTSATITEGLELINDGLRMIITDDPDQNRACHFAEQIAVVTRPMRSLLLERRSNQTQSSMEQYMNRYITHIIFTN